MPNFGDFQIEIYLAGIQGTKPDLPVALAGLEARAREVMAPEAYDYVAGGAGSEDTMAENLAAFRRWRIVPRHLRNVETRDPSVELFGRRLPAPMLLAPIGVQGIVHDDAEVAVARAASGLGVPLVLSTLSSKTLEEVAEACGDGPRWYQLYWPNDPELTASFLSRAEAAGFEAVVVTVDTNLLAWRPRDLEHAFLPFLASKGIANYLADPAFLKALEKSPDEDPLAAVMRWGAVYPHPSAVWEELTFIKEHTRLPVLLKGILHPDDARRAVELGMNGIIVSNHGGRQVDGAVATLDALPGVVDAVAGKVPVLLDSGIRTGADALKAVALGATAVLLGRPYIWGLAAGGEAGIRHVLRSFLADLDLTMALSGLARFRDITPDVLTRRS